MDCQVRVLGLVQERIQEQATVKGKQIYLERYTFHRQHAVGSVRATSGHGAIGFYGLSNFIGRNLAISGSVSRSVMPDSVIAWTVAHQAPRCMGSPRQEHWSVLPCPSPGDVPKLGLLNCRQILYRLSQQCRDFPGTGPLPTFWPFMAHVRTGMA